MKIFFISDRVNIDDLIDCLEGNGCIVRVDGDPTKEVLAVEFKPYKPSIWSMTIPEFWGHIRGRRG